jgi:hypothetical protein
MIDGLDGMIYGGDGMMYGESGLIDGSAAARTKWDQRLWILLMLVLVRKWGLIDDSWTE